MSITRHKSIAEQVKGDSKPKVNFAIRDTEFLIRLILANQIDGKDVEIASSVLNKIKKIHEKLMLKSQEII